MSDFSNVHSQFDDIVPDHPVVFISYSWDDDNHINWVRKLADDLRVKYGVNVLLDQYNRGGLDLLQFMYKGVKMADRVLLIGTPTYKQKSENYDKGGVRYEDQLISSQLYFAMGTAKFIPVLRCGTFENSFSSLIVTKTGFSMMNVDDKQYETVLQKIAAELWNEPLNAPPAVGPKPVFTTLTTSSHVVASKPTTSISDVFESEDKRLITDSNNEIAIAEQIEAETKYAYDAIMAQAKYDFTITPDTFTKYVNIHLEAVKGLLTSSLDVVQSGTKQQQKLIVDSIAKLCGKPLINSVTFIPETRCLQLLAATFLFHTLGVACVKYGKFHILLDLMTKVVPSPNVISSSSGLHLAFLAGVQHWDNLFLNSVMEVREDYPFSYLMEKSIFSYFQEPGLNKGDFHFIYATWEHLFSLMFDYYGCYFTSFDYFPHGQFEKMRPNLYAIDYPANFYTSFFSHLRTKHENWEPVNQGLFDGSFSICLSQFQKGEHYFDKHFYF